MKKAIVLCTIAALCGCTASSSSVTSTTEALLPVAIPEKISANSALMSESVIKPDTLDDYMFRDDVIYVDTRSHAQINEEGSIAGFVNIPFYDYICSFKSDDDTLFYMTKTDAAALGDAGSFVPLYEESQEIIETMFDHDKYIFVIATAGVESYYFINLLIQYGYDASKLYNVGSFTTGMGEDIAYSTYEDAEYYQAPLFLSNTVSGFSTAELTRIAQ